MSSDKDAQTFAFAPGATNRRARAVIWHGGSLLEEAVITVRPLRPHEVLVRIRAANVCISDHISLMPQNANPAQPYPQVPGHAAAGTVQELGSAVTDLAIGDTVIATGTPHCGICWYCLRDRAHQCAAVELVGPAFATTDDGTEVRATNAVGGMAELGIIPRTHLTPITTMLGFSELALLADGFGAGLGAALLTAPVWEGETVAVVGLGASGLAYIQGAAMAGAGTIIGIDPVATRRERALAAGAAHVIDPDAEDPVKAVWDIAGDVGGLQGRGADLVFEAAGSAKAMQQAWEMARSTGRVVLSSMPHTMSEMVEFPALPFALLSKTIYSSQLGSVNVHRDLPAFAEMAADGRIDISSLVDREYGIDEIGKAIEDVAAFRLVGAIIRL